MPVSAIIGFLTEFKTVLLEEILQTLFLVAFTLGLVLLGILYKRKLNRQANLLGSTYVSVSLMPLWNGYFRQTDSLNVLYAPLLDLLYPWLLGPLLYLYCRAIGGTRINGKDIISHCAWPGLVLLLAQVPGSWKAFISGQNLLTAYLILLYSQIFVYIYFAWQNSKKTRQMAESRYAGSAAEVWSWIDLILKGFAVIFFLDLLMLSVNLAGYLDQATTSAIFVVTESLYVFALIGFVFRQPQLFFDRFDTSKQVKYHNSGLNARLAHELAEKLHQIVDNEQLYLDNELSLPQLAKHLNVPEGHISQVLSQQLGQNFYEFINRKRVEHAKELLLSSSPEYGNILELAYLVGFNNKTSFNSAFKRFTQLTPSQFRQDAFQQAN